MTRVSELQEHLEQLSSSGDSIERVDALNDLADALLFSGEASSMFEYAEEAISMARRLGYASGQAFGLFYLGSANWLVTKLELALATLIEADAIFHELGEVSGRAKVRFMIGAAYRSLGDHDQAFLAGLEAVEFFAEDGDAVWEARARLSLAMTCHELGDFEGTRHHNERVLALREDSGEQWIVGRALSGIGAAFDALGSHRQALPFHLRALKVAETAGYRMGEARALHELGHSYERLGDRKKAFEFYSKGLGLREAIDQREAQCTSLIALGKLCMAEDTEQALAFLRRALKTAEQVGVKFRIYQAHLALSRIHEARGDLTEALASYKEFHRVHGEATQFTSGMRLKNLRTIFEAEKREREAEIARLKESLEEGGSLGSYRLIERLGSGGMGEVWVGEHRLLARPAAIKVIRARAVDDPGYEQLEQRFRLEAETTSSLRSPHTVQLFDFGVSDSGTFHYVMELLDGMDVRQIVERFGPLPPARLVYLLRQACRSLAEAHDNGLVHRDIKPANLFVAVLGGEYDFVKVLDFGMVKAGPDQDVQITSPGIMLGTPAFVAPEWVTGHGSMDGRGDLYSLGCTAFWALTGKPVFQGQTAMAMLMEHMKSPPPRVSQLSQHPVPQALEDLISRCLEKSPEARPKSAMEVWDWLGEIDCGPSWCQDLAMEWWAQHAPEAGSRRPVVSRRDGSAPVDGPSSLRTARGVRSSDRPI